MSWSGHEEDRNAGRSDHRGGISSRWPATPAHAAPPYWNKTEKCKRKDWDGRVVPTRVGNHELVWNHFSGKHNIKKRKVKCKIVNGPLNGKPDKKNGVRLEYWGYAINGGRQVKIVIIVYCSCVADLTDW